MTMLCPMGYTIIIFLAICWRVCQQASYYWNIPKKITKSAVIALILAGLYYLHHRGRLVYGLNSSSIPQQAIGDCPGCSPQKRNSQRLHSKQRREQIGSLKAQRDQQLAPITKAGRSLNALKQIKALSVEIQHFHAGARPWRTFADHLIEGACASLIPDPVPQAISMVMQGGNHEC